MHLEWGNKELAFSLIEKIARREGIGDVLANGVYEAARFIGRGAEEYSYHIKKLELLPWQLYMPYRALRTAISPRTDVTRAESDVPRHGLEARRKWQEEYVKSGFFSYPKEFAKLFLDDFVGLAFEYEKVVPFSSHDFDTNTLSNCSGLCFFGWYFSFMVLINLDDHIKLFHMRQDWI
jgi:aldehyde:ferredoxin oxidoreductase